MKDIHGRVLVPLTLSAREQLELQRSIVRILNVRKKKSCQLKLRVGYNNSLSEVALLFSS